MVFIGKISKTRGNKGEVVVEPAPDFDIFQISGRESVLLKSEKYEKRVVVEQVRDIGGTPVFKLAGINSISDALSLVGYSIFGAESLSLLPKKVEYVGYTVLDTKGQVWGKVIKLIEAHTNIVVEIGHEDEILLVPFHKEIVREINKKAKKIVIDPPDGLKDLNK